MSDETKATTFTVDEQNSIVEWSKMNDAVFYEAGIVLVHPNGTEEPLPGFEIWSGTEPAIDLSDVNFDVVPKDGTRVKLRPTGFGDADVQKGTAELDITEFIFPKEEESSSTTSNPPVNPPTTPPANPPAQPPVTNPPQGGNAGGTAGGTRPANPPANPPGNAGTRPTTPPGTAGGATPPTTPPGGTAPGPQARVQNAQSAAGITFTRRTQQRLAPTASPQLNAGLPWLKIWAWTLGIGLALFLIWYFATKHGFPHFVDTAPGSAKVHSTNGTEVAEANGSVAVAGITISNNSNIIVNIANRTYTNNTQSAVGEIRSGSTQRRNEWPWNSRPMSLVKLVDCADLHNTNIMRFSVYDSLPPGDDRVYQYPDFGNWSITFSDDEDGVLHSLNTNKVDDAVWILPKDYNGVTKVRGLRALHHNPRGVHMSFILVRK